LTRSLVDQVTILLVYQTPAHLFNWSPIHHVTCHPLIRLAVTY